MIAGQSLLPVVSQQTETHCVLPFPGTVTVAESVFPLTVPGSPLPMSPSVPCQGVAGSECPDVGVAARVTVPSTQKYLDAIVSPVAPFTVTEHPPR